MARHHGNARWYMADMLDLFRLQSAVGVLLRALSVTGDARL